MRRARGGTEVAPSADVLTVRDVMEPAVAVPAGASLSAVAATLSKGGGSCIVVDGGGRLVGVVRAARVLDALGRSSGTATAEELMEPPVGRVRASDSLVDTLEVLDQLREDRVPVVDGDVVCGQLTPSKLLRIVHAEWRTYSGELEGLLTERTTDLARARRVTEALLSMAIHELRWPVQSVLRTIEGLRRLSPAEDPEVREHLLDLATERARTILSVAVDLLEVSRLETGRGTLVRRPGPVKTVVEASFKALSGRARARGVRLTARGGEILGYYDPELMLRTLTRLLGALVEICPEGDTIQVAVAPCGPDERSREGWIRIALTSAAPASDGYRAALGWLPGPDAGEPSDGERLGLAFCRKVIEAHGGTLWLDAPATFSDGISISFVLPAAECTLARRPARGLVH